MRRSRCCVVAALLAASVLASAAEAQTGRALWPSGLDACQGHTAVVVASDAAAQSDVYSATTLAGVLGSRCLVDGGARDKPLPADSARLLDAAADDVWAVGGLAALPDAKLAGRTVRRVAGADRWATALAVGAEASNLAAGSVPVFTLIPATTNPPPPSGASSGGFVQVSAGGLHSCGLLEGGRVQCWGNDDYGQTAAPDG